MQAIIGDDLDVAQRTRNQWVWVPIEDVADMYHLSGDHIYANKYTFSNVNDPYAKSTTSLAEPVHGNYDYDHTNLKKNMGNISRNDFMQEMREEFAEMLKSVATYGGFYIGRYETGNTQKNNLRVVKGYTGTFSKRSANNRINSINWYSAYKRSKAIRKNNPVKTGLIWGIQWDEILVWLMKSGEKTAEEVITNSSTWGNYFNVSVEYESTSGLTEDGNGTEVGGTAATTSGSIGIIPTGSSEQTKANNIYDLAGNMYEWTMESYYLSPYSRRVIRGGANNKSGEEAPASYRYYHVPSGDGFYVGSRATLYIL